MTRRPVRRLLHANDYRRSIARLREFFPASIRDSG
jgi:hypothetical protein